MEVGNDVGRDSGNSVTRWVHQLRGGDEEAARQLWERFIGRLTQVARGRMQGVQFQLADEEDIVLSAFNSFCVGLRNGRFPELTGRDSLWRLLLVITSRKVADNFAFDHRGKRDSNRKVRLTEDELIAGLISREPSPQMAAEFSDQLATLLQSLVHQDLQQIALLKMQGFANREIALQLNRSMTTVERKLRTIRSIWRQVG